MTYRNGDFARDKFYLFQLVSNLEHCPALCLEVVSRTPCVITDHVFVHFSWE